MPRGKLRLPPHWSHVSTFLPTHQQNEVITLTLTGRSYLIKSQPPEHILVFKAENGIWSLPEISSREYLGFKLFHLHLLNPSSYCSVFIPDDRLVSRTWFFSRVPPWYFLSSTSPKSSPAKETIAQRVSFIFSSINIPWLMTQKQIRWKSVVWI